ncbi:MAG: AtpZ/AtpI family protein [Candidatus Zixiibacteriota bacterium]|nr:MAG: AtpZ/AtpI family protein [candidate division Zixibacteria bacterium]
MAPFYPKPNGKPGKEIKQASLLITIPAIMFAAPAIGYFIGNWADKKFGTSPYLLVVGVIFGFAAAGIEVYRLVKRSSDLDESERNENGT